MKIGRTPPDTVSSSARLLEGEGTFAREHLERFYKLSFLNPAMMIGDADQLLKHRTCSLNGLDIARTRMGLEALECLLHRLQEGEIFIPSLRVITCGWQFRWEEHMMNHVQKIFIRQGHRGRLGR